MKRNRQPIADLMRQWRTKAGLSTIDAGERLGLSWRARAMKYDIFNKDGVRLYKNIETDRRYPALLSWNDGYGFIKKEELQRNHWTLVPVVSITPPRRRAEERNMAITRNSEREGYIITCDDCEKVLAEISQTEADEAGCDGALCIPCGKARVEQE